MRRAVQVAFIALLCTSLVMAQTPVPRSGASNIVPTGTEIRATLDKELSSKTSQAGEQFTATVAQDVMGETGQVLIPAGSRLRGEVTNVEEGKTAAAIRGRGRLNMRFIDVQLLNGRSAPISATLQSVHDPSGEKSARAKTDEEGQVQARTSGRDVARDVGIGAAAGTVAGLIFGSALKGLAIGAIAGGGYVLAKRGEEVELKPNSGLVLRLDQPFSPTGRIGGGRTPLGGTTTASTASQTQTAQATTPPTAATQQQQTDQPVLEGRRTSEQVRPDEVAAGTQIKATLDQPLSSKTAKEGDTFTATVAEPVRSADGNIAFPVGSKIHGVVANVEEGEILPAVRGRGSLNLRFQEVRTPTGEAAAISATLVSLHDTQGERPERAGTTEEGEVEARTEGKDVARDIGIGAAVGTVAGLIFGSPLKGLLIGAAAGGGYVLATRGRDVKLEENTGMVLQLEQNVPVPR